MSKKEVDVSVWLVPEEEQRQSLQVEINRLADKYGACSFVPHITLYHPQTSMEPNRVVEILEVVLGGVGPIELEAEEVRWEEQFTKTLYVRYITNLQLDELFEKIKTELGKFRDYELVPHLSVVYSTKMTEEDKAREAKELEYPRSIRLDRVMVIVKEGTTIAKEKDVKSWQMAWEKKLG